MENKSSILSLLETMNGLGVMLGPFFGGLRYELGGFYFPFAICGGLLTLSAMLSALSLTNGSMVNPSLKLSNDVVNEEMLFVRRSTYCQLLKLPPIFICCGLLIIAQTSVTW